MAGTKQPAMDSGFSWIVLAASSASMYTICILSASAGILKVEMVDDLQVGSGVISTMFALSIGFTTLLGPLSGIVSNMLTIRFSMFIGTCLMSIGLLATSFCHSMAAMIFFYGIVTGVGAGLSYCPCIVILSKYFEKRLMLANAVLFCTAGLSTMTWPYFVRYMIDTFGWRYYVAINGGILLHMMVFASFFVPTPAERRRLVKPSFCCYRTGDASINGSYVTDDDRGESSTEVKGKETTSAVSSSEKEISVSRDGDGDVTSYKKIQMKFKNSRCGDTQSLGSGGNLTILQQMGVRKPYVPVYINGTPEAARSFLNSQVTDLIVSESTYNGHFNSLDDVHLDSRSQKPLRGSSVSQLSCQSFNVSRTDNSHVNGSGHLSSRTVKSHGLGQHQKQKQQLRNRKNFLGSSLVFASSEFGSSIMLPISIQEITITKKTEEEDEDNSLRATMSRLRKNKVMWIVCVHCFLFMSAAATHGIHFPAFVASKGLDAHYVSLFYTVFGLCILCGRLFGGFIFHKLKPPLLILLFVLELIDGLVLGLCPFYASTPAGIFVLEIFIGLSYGQAFMLQPLLIGQYVLPQDLPIAYGITQFSNGIGSILAPILAGYIYDATHTYDIPMHVAGASVIMGALILTTTIFVKTDIRPCQQDKEQDEGDEEEKTHLHFPNESSSGDAEESKNAKRDKDEETVNATE